jgi:hypothetical protein
MSHCRLYPTLRPYPTPGYRDVYIGKWGGGGRIFDNVIWAKKYEKGNKKRGKFAKQVLTRKYKGKNLS